MAESRRKVIYENAGFRLFWDDETKLIESIFPPEPSGQEIKVNLERMLVFIREKKARKYLADMTLLGNNVPGEDILWAETDWFPRCLKTGLKSIAIVMPKALATHLTIDKEASQISMQGYERRFFKDVQSAREWITKQ